MEPELTPYQEGLLRQIGHFVDTVFAEQIRAEFVARNNAEAEAGETRAQRDALLASFEQVQKRLTSDILTHPEDRNRTALLHIDSVLSGRHRPLAMETARAEAAEARLEAVKAETVRALEDHAQPIPEGFIYGGPDSRLSAVTCGCGDLLPVTRRSMVLDCWRRHVAERLDAALSAAPQPVIGIALQSVKAGEVFELYVNSNYFAAPQPESGQPSSQRLRRLAGFGSSGYVKVGYAEPARCEHGQVKAHIYCPHHDHPDDACWDWQLCNGPDIPTS
jgi:hypothetical protein